MSKGKSLVLGDIISDSLLGQGGLVMVAEATMDPVIDDRKRIVKEDTGSIVYTARPEIMAPDCRDRCYFLIRDVLSRDSCREEENTEEVV